eukprot:1445990-Rhodomonas_salina.1
MAGAGMGQQHCRVCCPIYLRQCYGIAGTHVGYLVSELSYMPTPLLRDVQYLCRASCYQPARVPEQRPHPQAAFTLQAQKCYMHLLTRWPVSGTENGVSGTENGYGGTRIHFRTRPALVHGLGGRAVDISAAFS